MKIKRLEIVGFKSFVDKTVIKFDHDVTGIVGPNGCGKSNVVDAIKWVMGEQAPNRLRGKAMDDVIFNGSESRGPHGFAEVSLTFDNTDGLTPPEYRDYPEITVSRRLDRSGRSDYLINRAPVRLMDITNLFLGTGVGRRAYSIIEQGRIGYIVSSKPADRRAMIEEAAGITKFKVRKRAAERKMDQTRQNLLRVGDILGELDKNLASLKRQAQKAERYKKYRAEVRDLELWDSTFRYLDLFTESRVVSKLLDARSAQEDGVRTALRVREAELEAERAHVDGIGTDVERAQNEAYRLDNEVRVLEGHVQQSLDRLLALQEREQLAERELGEVDGERRALAQEQGTLQSALQGLESAHSEAQAALAAQDQELERRRMTVAEAEREVSQSRGRLGEAERRIVRAEAVVAGHEQRRTEGRERLEKLRAEREQLERTHIELKHEHGALHARLEGLRSGRQHTAAKKEDIERELAELREEIKRSDQSLERLRVELADKRSRLTSLRELQERFEGVGAGVRALLTSFAPDTPSRQQHGLVGLVADRIRCPVEFTNALAGALGDRLQDVIVNEQDAGVAALNFLREQGEGRARLVPQNPKLPETALPGCPEHTDVVGRLADLVESAPDDHRLVKHLLRAFVVVKSLPVALELHRQGAEATLVTLDGEVVGPDGALTGGGGNDGAAHLLEMQRETRGLSGVVAELDAQLRSAVDRHGNLRRNIATRQAAIDTARTEAHDAELSILSADKDLRRVASESEAAAQRAHQLAEEIDQLTQSLRQADGEQSLATEEIASARQAQGEAERELSAAQAIYGQRQSSVEEQAARVTEVRVRAAQATERVERDRSALERLSRSITDLQEREARLRGDVAEGAREQGRLVAQVYGDRERLHDSVGLAMRAHESLGGQRERFEQARAGLGHAELQLKELRSQIDDVTGEVGNLTVRNRELSMQTQHLLDNVQERHRVDLRRELGAYHDRALPDEAMRQRISELLRLIDRMGEINLMAIEEYEEKSERHRYLTDQKTDLEEALLKLDRAIRKMNKESRRMFKEAFVAVNERFKRIFPELFRGGRAELKLSDPNDLLESGVDIVAQPPGKKLGALELMSGGEKALTATALVFALFQYKPSPFCLLDEVDAPLDEANISRFAQAIRQMTDRSQFIVITHSKRTMEFTDVLYGVTMEQPGVSKLVSVELRGDKRPLSRDPAAAVA